MGPESYNNCRDDSGIIQGPGILCNNGESDGTKNGK